MTSHISTKHIARTQSAPIKFKSNLTQNLVCETKLAASPPEVILVPPPPGKPKTSKLRLPLSVPVERQLKAGDVSAACKLTAEQPAWRRYEALMLVFEHLRKNNLTLASGDEKVLRQAAIGTARYFFKNGGTSDVPKLIAQSPQGFPTDIARCVLKPPLFNVERSADVLERLQRDVWQQVITAAVKSAVVDIDDWASQLGGLAKVINALYQGLGWKRGDIADALYDLLMQALVELNATSEQRDAITKLLPLGLRYDKAGIRKHADILPRDVFDEPTAQDIERWQTLRTLQESQIIEALAKMDAPQARRILRIVDVPEHHWLGNLVELKNLGDEILSPSWCLEPGAHKLSVQFRKCLAGAPKPMRPALAAIAQKIARPAAERLIWRIIRFDESNKPVFLEEDRGDILSIEKYMALAGMYGEPYMSHAGLVYSQWATKLDDEFFSFLNDTFDLDRTKFDDMYYIPNLGEMLGPYAGALLKAFDTIEPTQLAKLAALEPADSKQPNSARAELFKMMFDPKRGPLLKIGKIVTLLGYESDHPVHKAMEQISSALAGGSVGHAQKMLEGNEQLSQAEPLFVELARERLKQIKADQVRK